jgi:rhamnogalacturonyl hydrolase YesR
MTFHKFAAAIILCASTAIATQAARAQSKKDAPIAVAVRLADWQLAHMGQVTASRKTNETENPRSWEQAVFWVGMTELADAGAPPRIRKAIMKMGEANGWEPGHRTYFADDHVISQSYLWAAANGAGDAARTPTRRVFDKVIDEPAVTTLAFYVPPEGYGAAECLKRWCWCDALFMAPPAFAELSKQVGDDRYRTFAMKEWWATTDFLFDPKEHLYYRDSRFFERRDAKGRKMFWSRGNGWVFGGIARTLPLLPEGSADRKKLEALFVEMAARLRELQKPDGYWPPSLLAPEDSPPETSGTGFFTYGMAWGIRAGLLPRDQYEPVVRRGWAALTRAIQPDGRLGWVQQVSDRPESVAASDTQFYGVGAFLLAATAVAELDQPPR